MRSWPILMRFSPAKTRHSWPRRAEQSSSEQPHRRHRDSSAETNIDITAGLAMAELILPRKIQIALFLVPIIEGQGIWIEIAPDDFRSFRVRRQVRQVYTVKKTRLD